MTKRERIERVMASPGWMRLFKGFGGLWAAGFVSFGLGILAFSGSSHMDVGFGLVSTGVFVPIGLYVLARLTAWVVRGFLE